MCPQRVSPTTINFRRLQLLHFALFQPTSFKVKPCCVFQGLEDWGIIEKKRGKLWRNFSGLQLQQHRTSCFLSCFELPALSSLFFRHCDHVPSSRSNSQVRRLSKIHRLEIAGPILDCFQVSFRLRAGCFQIFDKAR